MKHILATFLFSILYLYTLGQSEANISLSFSSSVTGNHVRLGYQTKSFGKFKTNFGIKYLDGNESYRTASSGLYKQKFYGDGFLSHLGLFGGVSLTVIDVVENVRAYVFLDFQINSTGVTGTVLRYQGNVGDIYTYKQTRYKTDPFLNWEVIPGFGIECTVLPRWSFFAEGGIGIAFFHDIPEPFFDNFDYEFSPYVQTGLRFKLKDDN